jgi:TatA/E family protein of Tat protein translocase
MFGNPMEIALIVGAAVLLFGADKLPKLARSLGNAKKEFAVGQVEADVAAEKARQEMLKKLEDEKAASGAAHPQTTEGKPTAP